MSHFPEELTDSGHVMAEEVTVRLSASERVAPKFCMEIFNLMKLKEIEVRGNSFCLRFGTGLQL
jgi:hypothetical protein